MGNLNVYLSVIIGIGYIFYTIIGKYSLEPKDQYYNRLLETKPFILNLSFAAILVIIGIWRVAYYDKRETFYFAPLIYLLLLRLFNLFSILINQRNLILATGVDNPPKGKEGINFSDRVFVFLLFLVPVIICGMIMNKLNFGVFME